MHLYGGPEGSVSESLRQQSMYTLYGLILNVTSVTTDFLFRSLHGASRTLKLWGLRRNWAATSRPVHVSTCLLSLRKVEQYSNQRSMKGLYGVRDERSCTLAVSCVDCCYKQVYFLISYSLSPLTYLVNH
jgi:hypothetical protein